MELTRVFSKEELERLIKNWDINSPSKRITKELAKALLGKLEEPSVWTDAPDEAGYAYVIYYIKKETGVGSVGSKEYTRELLKSPEREIAEEVASHWEGGKEALEKAIKSAILQARKEREAER